MFEQDDECGNWRRTCIGNEKKNLERFLGQTGAAYLIKKEDWLLQLHHEADLLWMVTEDGIDADPARFSPAEKKTARELLENNKDLHRQEKKLYEKQEDFDDYRLREGTVYRSATGYALFVHLTKELDERYRQ